MSQTLKDKEGCGEEERSGVGAKRVGETGISCRNDTKAPRVAPREQGVPFAFWRSAIVSSKSLRVGVMHGLFPTVSRA